MLGVTLAISVAISLVLFCTACRNADDVASDALARICDDAAISPAAA
jgi:hypothetical protein